MHRPNKASKGEKGLARCPTRAFVHFVFSDTKRYLHHQKGGLDMFLGARPACRICSLACQAVRHQEPKLCIALLIPFPALFGFPCSVPVPCLAFFGIPPFLPPFSFRNRFVPKLSDTNPPTVSHPRISFSCAQQRRNKASQAGVWQWQAYEAQEHAKHAYPPAPSPGQVPFRDDDVLRTPVC